MATPEPAVDAATSALLRRALTVTEALARELREALGENMSGIEFAKQTEDGLELLCDCGAITVLTGGEPGDPLPSGSPGAEQGAIRVPATGGEAAFTCHGCGSPHWLTFTPRKDQP